jgi:hypothetical protein
MVGSCQIGDFAKKPITWSQKIKLETKFVTHSDSSLTGNTQCLSATMR